jgi:uncharacterized protein YkwD
LSIYETRSHAAGGGLARGRGGVRGIRAGFGYGPGRRYGERKGLHRGKIALKADEKRMLDLHNQRRKSQELRRLCVHPALQRTARDHSQDMIRRDYFEHGDVGKRLKRHGYNWSTYAENIAPDPGSPSLDPTFDTWMDSQEHRANIMSRKFKEVGIGLATGTHNGERKTMWTADFGSRS